MGLAAGRSVSVALRLICERVAAIAAFVPRAYWTVEAEVETEDGVRFPATPVRLDGAAVADREGRTGPHRATLCHREEDPGRAANDAPVRPLDRVRTAGERLRRMARPAALVRLAQVPARREARLYRQPVGRVAGLPARRARRDGQQLR